MKDTSERGRILKTDIGKWTDSIYCEKGLPEDESPSYSLSHKLGFEIQKNIQLIRSEIHRKTNDTAFEPSDFQIVPLTVNIPQLKSAFKEYRIVQISDIHLGQWITPERLDGVIDLVNQQEPDLVAITGDFVSYVLDPIADDLIRSLKRLRPHDATVAVLGNHDHWVGAKRVRSIIGKSNVLDLSNDVLSIARGTKKLYIAGVDSVMANKDRLDLVLGKLPLEKKAILLAHEPDFAIKSSRTGRFSLQLSGHSHGGQFVIPYIGTPIRSTHFWKFPLGKYQIGEMIQYTNRGLGTNLFWSRINCPPEITVITLGNKRDA